MNQQKWFELAVTAVARQFGAVTAAYQQLPRQPLAAVEQAVGGGKESILLFPPDVFGPPD
jgi:hypothetical protein